MPHINVKMYPGRDITLKQKLADEIARVTCQTLECSIDAVSVAVEEIAPEKWGEAVFKPEISQKEETLLVKPNYNPL
ncbi:MAG: tautomerase family protein [Spirochaetales bacterium]|nr:tautomerase family protein [Spirochaetales bacterium]